MKHDFPSKIIFLDTDGVFNIPPYLKFDKRCLENLQTIIDKTGAKIVVSSSWRDEDSERMKVNYIEHGFTEKLWDEIIDITCRGYSNVIKGSKLPIVRGNEIKAWVDTHLKYPWHVTPSLGKHYQLLNEDGSFKIMNSNKLGIDYQYVILDDDTDMLYEQKDNFVNTDGMVGLTSKDVEKAIQILNNIKD